MKASDKDDCGHSCFDAECQGDADPLCPVHGMTPNEVYEAARKAAEGATVAVGGWCAPSVMSPAEARERWKELTFHEHYGHGAPRGHWEWRSEHTDDGWRWISEGEGD